MLVLIKLECRQDCPIGARCDGSSLKGLVDGSQWVPNQNTGYYNLASCPARYELSVKGLANGSFAYQAQECIPCPTSRYCPGGTDLSIPCIQGTFALPGTADTLADCLPTTFVYITVLVRAPPPVATQPALVKEIARAASVPVDTVLMIGATDEERNSSVVQLRIAASETAKAHEICKSLEVESIRLDSVLPNDPFCQLLSCALDVIAPGTWNSNLIAALCAAAFCVVLCTVCARILYDRHNSEESEMMKATKQLRHRLKIQLRDGYRIDSDWVYPWQNVSKAMHLHKRCIESAIKLSLLRDFNPLEFDSFCVCLIQPEHQYIGRSMQHIALYDWILETATWLLKPSVIADKSTINPETGREWTERERFQFLKKLCQCQVHWSIIAH